MSHRRTFLKLDDMSKGFNSKVMDWKKAIECDAKREETLECIKKAVPPITEQSAHMSDTEMDTSEESVVRPDEESMIIDDNIQDLQSGKTVQEFTEQSNNSATLIAQNKMTELHVNIKSYVQNSMGIHFDEQLFTQLMDILMNKEEICIIPDYISLVLAKLRQQRAPGFQIIGDNIDLHVKPKHMTSTNQNKDIHWFNLNAILNRVTGNDLSDSKSIKSMADMASIDFLPSQDDNLAFLADLIPLAARVVADKIPAFQKFKGCAVGHIPHKYSDVMAKKSNQVYRNLCFQMMKLNHIKT